MEEVSGRGVPPQSGGSLTKGVGDSKQGVPTHGCDVLSASSGNSKNACNAGSTYDWSECQGRSDVSKALIMAEKLLAVGA